MIRSHQDAAAGSFMIAVAAIAFWQGANLDIGTLRHLGPGMMPYILAGLTAFCGLLLLIGAFTSDGPKLERWTIRGPVCILGAAIIFGLTIRPLGLVIAGPLAMLLGCCATRETRWLETIIFSIVMTAFCVGLFRYMLNLPIPIAPWLLGN